MGSISAPQAIEAKKIAVIGAGASGLAAAKFLIAEQCFLAVDVFEQRSSVGGLWAYTPQDSGDGLFEVPSTNPHRGPESPLWAGTGPGTSCPNLPVFLSPLYERLETNIPRSLMRYAEMDFDPSVQLFPKHEDVQQYLEHYADGVREAVKLNTQVTDVYPSRNCDVQEGNSVASRWTVKTVHLPTGAAKSSTYDAVIVGSGHFSVPYIPSIPGIAEWNTAFPGSISHSKYYRIPEACCGKKIIVVGNSASGLDISSQIASVCESPLFLSSKTESYLAPGFKTNPNIENVAEIIEFNSLRRSIRLRDGNVIHGVDAILFCTGYLYSMPFLKDIKPPPIGDGSRVQNTYQHLFYSPMPTLAFLTLPQKIIPFPLAEVQAAVVARVYAGRLALPPLAEMKEWEAKEIEERGAGGDFHTLQFPNDANYINMLYDWAISAELRPGLENGGKGKLGRRWDEWHFWARERFPAIRRAFVEKGDGRKNVKTLQEVGFDFHKWKVDQGLLGSGPSCNGHKIDQKGAL